MGPRSESSVDERLVESGVQDSALAKRFIFVLAGLTSAFMIGQHQSWVFPVD